MANWQSSPRVNLVLTGATPTRSLELILTPSTGTLTLTGAAVIPTRGFYLTPNGVVLTFSGISPSLKSTLLVTAGLLTIRGEAVVTGKAAFPSTGQIVTVGQNFAGVNKTYNIAVARLSMQNPTQSVLPIIPIPVGVIITPLPTETLPPIIVLS